MVAKVFQGILFAATSIIIFQMDYEYSKTASKKIYPQDRNCFVMCSEDDWKKWPQKSETTIIKSLFVSDFHPMEGNP